MLILWATAAWSVDAMTEQTSPDSHEIQQVEEEFSDEPRSEEATLLEELQAKLQAVEERERGLQLREEQVLALQRDVGGSPAASPTSRWACARRVRESTSKST